jgi:predicted metal-dependent phosphoesterase TrpH
MLKADLHIHTSDDPLDSISYSSTELIDHAASLGYDALAITLHERQLDTRQLERYAADRGIVLIPGIEQTIEGKHVLLLNFSRRTEDVRTFDDLARLRRLENGIVIAPHVFFPSPTCLWGRIERYADLFDAVEVNAMFTRTVDFNRRAVRSARRHGKPIVGNGDVHTLRQLGTTYSLIDALPDPESICAAIRADRVQVEARPLSWGEAAGIMAELFGWRTRAGSRVERTPASDSTSISLPQSV